MNKAYAQPMFGGWFEPRAKSPRTPRPSRPFLPQAETTTTASMTASRVLFDVLSLLGWVYLAIVAAGALVTGVVIAIQSPLMLIGVILGWFFVSIPGLFIIASAQVSRSIVDTAEHTRRLVELMVARTTEAS